MNKGITIELHFFMISILWGAIILLAYDLLRVLRRIINHNIWVITFEDLIFWVLSSLFIFIMIYENNSGTIRGFSVMGMGIGMVLYHYIFSERIVWLISQIILILLRPFSFLINLIRKMLGIVLKKIKRCLCKLHIQLKKQMKSVKIYIYNYRLKKKAKAKLKKEEKQKNKKNDKKNKVDKNNKKDKKNNKKKKKNHKKRKIDKKIVKHKSDST